MVAFSRAASTLTLVAVISSVPTACHRKEAGGRQSEKTVAVSPDSCRAAAVNDIVRACEICAPCRFVNQGNPCSGCDREVFPCVQAASAAGCTLRQSCGGFVRVNMKQGKQRLETGSLLCPPSDH